MQKKILVCTNYRANPNSPSCAARGSKQVLAALRQQLQHENVSIAVEELQCMGHCKVGPNVRLIPNGEYFHTVSSDTLSNIIQATKRFIAD